VINRESEGLLACDQDPGYLHPGDPHPGGAHSGYAHSGNAHSGDDRRGRALSGTGLPGTGLPGAGLPSAGLPPQTIRGTTIPRTCFDSGTYPEPAQTTVRVSNYAALDQEFSASRSDSYWKSAGSAPDYTAPGFGGVNAAGFPKNQYVRSYVRRDGTFVRGYWRNSPSDGLPTCRIIDC
jgi:hypothetical protein